MAIPLPFDIRYDERVDVGVAVFDNSWRMPGEFSGVLLFHDASEYQRWRNGASFRLKLINTRQPPEPKYDKAERMKKRKHK